MLGVRSSFDWHFASAGAFCGAIAILGAFRRRAIELHKPCEIDFAAKPCVNAVRVSVVAVGR
jgi:hypothetical protein